MMGRVPACHTLWVVGAYRRGQIMIDRGASSRSGRLGGPLVY